MSNMGKLVLGHPIKTNNASIIFKRPLERVVGHEPNPPLRIKKYLDSIEENKKYREQVKLSEERNQCKKINPHQ